MGQAFETDVTSQSSRKATKSANSAAVACLRLFLVWLHSGGNRTAEKLLALLPLADYKGKDLRHVLGGVSLNPTHPHTSVPKNVKQSEKESEYHNVDCISMVASKVFSFEMVPRAS